MGLFFGTDGIRGEVGKNLTFEIVYRCANALAKLNPHCNFLIGYDTRLSGSSLASAFCLGAAVGGSNITNIGVCPTAGVAFLTNKLGYDYGVVISASHNPAEFNGIKIFDKNGKKLTENIEKEIEKNLLITLTMDFKNLGVIDYNSKLVEIYKDFLINHSENLNGLKIVLDCSNGASFSVAPEVFERVGSTVVAISNQPNGLNINKECGSLNIEQLKKSVIENNADMGFAFDGDSDRVVAVDENGTEHDGDHLLYMLAVYYQKIGKLKGNAVVGTVHTNSGVEVALKKLNIQFLRTPVGDKYVSEKLDEQNLIIGGEQAGHIFLKDKLPTGDGILNALTIASISKFENSKLSSYFTFQSFYQKNNNIKTENKQKIINHAKLQNLISKSQNMLGDGGRVLVRASGTEPLVRIMVESSNENICNDVSEFLIKEIQVLEKELCLCVE